MDAVECDQPLIEKADLFQKSGLRMRKVALKFRLEEVNGYRKIVTIGEGLGFFEEFR